MKKLLFFALLFCVMQSNAQTNIYHPFPDSSAFWNEEAYWHNGTIMVFNPEIEFFGGDTTISSVHYKKIIANGYEYAGPTTCCSYGKYLGALRQDSTNKKVYFYSASASQESLLYDFNLHVGDTIGGNYVSKIDSILIGTTYRNQYVFSAVNGQVNYYSIIEGIGSTFGFIYGLSTPAFENGSNLICFSQNGVTLYPNATSSCSSTFFIEKLKNNQSVINIFPNPAQNNFTIETNDTEKQTLQIFDVNGKQVLTQTVMGTTNIDAGMLAQGVYNVCITGNEGVVNKRLVVVR